MGILMGLKLPVDPVSTESICLILIVLYGWALKTFHTGFGICSPWLALLSLTIFAFAGMVRLQTKLHQPDSQVATADYLLAEVIVPTYQKGRNHITTLAIARIWSQGTNYIADDHLQWYQVTNHPAQLPYGTQVLLKGSPVPIERPPKPQGV